MSKFSVIACSGHCGSTWLASVLDSQRNVIWHHHWREEMTGRPWETLDLLPPDHEMFDQYWRWLRGELHMGDVGDANSWPPHLLPEVNEVQPIDRVIYLTRNGIQQLHSLATASPALQKDPLPKVAEVKIRALYNIGYSNAEMRYDQATRWEKLSVLVAANEFMPDWLRDKGLTVDVHSLEELTRDIGLLRELAPELDDTTLLTWQRRDINRKVQGGRAPSTLWRQWSKEQKRAYRDIVGIPEIKKPSKEFVLAL